MSEIKRKEIDSESFPGIPELNDVFIDSEGNNDNSSRSIEEENEAMSKLGDIFKFNVYVSQEILAFRANYNYPVDVSIEKKLSFYIKGDIASKEGNLSIKNINPVVIVADAFKLNLELQNREFKILEDTLVKTFNSHFSIDRSKLKSLIINGIFDEGDMLEHTFNITEKLRIIYSYIYTSRKTRKGMI